MGLFGLFERRASVESGTTPLTSNSLLELLGGVPGDSGIAVTETSALTMSAVYRCVSLIASVSAALPLHSYTEGTKGREDTRILLDPHPDFTPLELWRLAYVHRCLWGNAYLQKVTDSVNRIRELWPITPSRVQVGRLRPTAANPTGKVFRVTDDWGEYHLLTPREVLHIPGLGYDGLTGCSPVRLASQAIGTALAAEKYGAKLFGSGNLLSGILQTDQRLQEADARRLQARWEKLSSGLDRSHKVAVLDSGAKFESLTMPNDDAEMLDSRRFQVTDVSRFFGVPQFLLGETAKSTSWGTGLEQQSLAWVMYDLHPQWLAPHERRVTKELLPSGRYAKYSVEGLLRGDSESRASFYRTMREVGGYSANDIRDLEDKQPVPNGDGLLQPLNFVELGSTAPPTGDMGGAGDEGDRAAELLARAVTYLASTGSSNGHGTH